MEKWGNVMHIPCPHVFPFPHFPISWRSVILLLLAVTSAFTQFDLPGRRHRTDVTYDGRFTFARLQWRSDGRMSRGFWSSAWDHDYPRAEQNVSLILKELT